jgi:beta-glucanase (GH16 family)
MPPWARDWMTSAMEAARRLRTRVRALAAPAVGRAQALAARALHHVLNALQAMADHVRPRIARAWSAARPHLDFLGRYLAACWDILRTDTATVARAAERWITRIAALTLSEIWNAPFRLAHRGAIGAFTLFALLSSAPPPQPAVQEAVKPQGAWILVWNDEFEGAAVDRRKWSVVATPPAGPTFGDSYFADSPETVRVAGGVLEMRAAPIGKGKYSGARLETQGLASWRYGRFEARIKVAQGAGALTSFWMLHRDPSLERWPLGGEIDILEQLGRHPTLMEGVIHHKGVDRKRNHVIKWTDEPLGDDFHVFALEWTPEGFFWFLDGELVHAYPPHDAHPFNRDFFLILSLCVGGDWALAPDRHTKFPLVTQVDWVRVYAINPDHVRPERDARAAVAQQGVDLGQAPSGL